MRALSVVLILAFSAGCAVKRVAPVNSLPSPSLQEAPAPAPVAPRRPKRLPDGTPEDGGRAYLERRIGSSTGELPFERYEIAQTRMDRMRTYRLSQARVVPAAELAASKASAKAANRIDLGGWEPLGPGNQGGRSRHLLIDPRDTNVMYVSAVVGGVWKTTDAGASWAPLTDFFPSLGIGGLTFEPGNPDTIYAGTGFWFNSLSSSNLFGSAPRGAGIYRTRDAGQKWELLASPAGNHFRYINEILVSRNDVNRIYVATWTGIFRSLDAGQTWTQVLNRGNTGQNGCQDMVMRTDQQTDYLFAACGTTAAGGAAIFRNTDASGAGSWSEVLRPAAMANTTLALAPSNQSIVYALMASNGADDAQYLNSLHAVYRSNTNGDPDTWEIRTSNKAEDPLNRGLLSTNSGFYTAACGGTPSISGQGWIHNAIAVDPKDPERLFVAGIDIYRSDDGGRTWGIGSFWQVAETAQGAHADVLGLWFPPDYDPASKPSLYATTDGGVYLAQNALGSVTTGLRGGCTASASNIGLRWKPLHGGYQSTQFYFGAVMPGGGAFIGGKQDNGTMRGTLAGKSEWVRIRGGDGTSLAVDPRDPNTVFVTTQNFSLTRSRDAGRTFTGVTRGLEAAANFAFVAPLAMDPSNPGRLYAGATRFYRTDDQADNWKQISPVMPTAQGYVTSIAVSPSDPARVVYGTSQGFVYSTNANVTEAEATTEWTFSRPRPGYLPALAFDPADANVVYAAYSQFNTAAGQSHVYRSPDGGRTWVGIDGTGDDGIPDIPVFSILVDPLDTNRIYLGTDLGVFVTLDRGVTWMRDQNPFATLPTETLLLERGAGSTWLYAFTFGRGVWRTQLPNTGAPCEYKLGSMTDVSAFGGELSIPVDTGDGCVWSAIPQSQSGVLDIVTSTGRGPGAVKVSVGLNTSANQRRLALWLHDKAAESSQSGAVAVPASADNAATAVAVNELPYVGFRDSRLATAVPDDRRASCAPVAPAKTLWWRVTAPADGQIELVFMGQRYDVFGNSGMVVSVLDAATNGEVGCGTSPRNTTAWTFQNLRFAASAGKAYLVQVSALGTAAQDGGHTVLGMRMAP